MAHKSIPRISRDTILFASGLMGVAWETFGQNAERPTLLLLFGAMIGLPVFLRADEARKDQQPSDPSVPTVPVEVNTPVRSNNEEI